MGPRETWLGLCGRLGPSADADALFLVLEALYAHPPRAYHSLAHIEDCVHRLAAARHLAVAPDEAELALWLHDCIYIPGRPDNEERSAAVAGVFARELGCTPRAAERVASMILATKHKGEPLDGDAALVADIDMSILAAPARDYARYAAAIRAEYAFASEGDYRRGRGAFIRGLLGRPAIYHTSLAGQWEGAARANLSGELAEIGGP